MKFLTTLTLFMALIYSSSSHAMTALGGGGYFLMLVAIIVLGIILLLLWTVKFLKRVKSDCTKVDAEQKD